MKNKKVLLIIGIGALGLYAFYRYRKGLPILPSFGGLLAGQGTAGSGGSLNAGFVGQSNLPQVPTQTMSESERIRLRNLATGAGSRSSCIIDAAHAPAGYTGSYGRWIDTQTPPFYGICVSQANFTRWLNAGYQLGDNQPTLEFVKRALGI